MSTVEINKQMKLSEHFTLGEMTKTTHKTADGNIPTPTALENLKRLCRWLEMLRDEWNKRYGEGNEGKAEKGSYTASLRSGDYLAEITLEGYSTSTHVSVKDADTTRDLLLKDNSNKTVLFCSFLR